MTVKTTLDLLLLTCLALSAQNTPNPAAPDSPGDAPPNVETNAPPNVAPDAPPSVPPDNAPPVVVSTNAPAPNPVFPGSGPRVIPLPPPGNRRVRGDAARGGVPAAPGAVPGPGGAFPGANPPPAVAPAPGVGGPPAFAAAPGSKPADEVAGGFDYNYSGADLTLVLNQYADLVHRSVLRSPTLPNPNIFFKNQTPLTRTEAIQAHQALFAMSGVALIEVGDKFLKAVPAAEAIAQGQKPLILTNAADLPELGQFVTHIVQLKFVKPTEMVPVLQPFFKMPNAAYPIDSSQILVLRDYTENVKRMLELIDKVDVAFQSEFESEVIPIKFAKAEDIATALNGLSGSGGGSATTVGTRATGGGGGAGASRMGNRPGLGGYQSGMTGAMGQQGMLGGANPAGTPSSGASFSQRINDIVSRAAKASGSADFQIIGQNKIVADVRSNSLMVFASHNDMKTIKDIISKLDIVLAQVVIETIIMDVSLDDAFNFGVSAVQSQKQFGNSFAGAGGMNANKFFNFSNSSATNAAGDLLGSGLRYFGKVNDDIYLTVEAMASDGRVNVIQKPRVQTSHATPASIFVGSTVPYVASTYYGGGYAGGPSSSYQQMQVGIGLNVTPFINHDGLVVMQIDETIDEISSYTKIDNNSVPNTSHRAISAEVAVRDGETILLGGFIRNSESKNKSGVPFLKDLPLLGSLFSSQDSTKSRKELMVLMRPTVLRTPELAAMHVAEEKKDMPGVVQAEAEAARTQQAVAEKAAKEAAGKAAHK